MTELTPKEDVLMDVVIEMQRMFQVLSNAKSKVTFPEHARLLTNIETSLKKCLEEVEQRLEHQIDS